MKLQMGEQTRQKCLLIIVAMDVEEKAVIEALGEYDTWVVSEALDISVKVFEKSGRKLIVARSGIGLANAAATTALTLAAHSVDGVLLFGVAGAITESLNIGDVILATSIIQHDSVFSGDAGVELMAPGCLFVTAALHEIESPIFKTDAAFRRWFRSTFAGQNIINYAEGTLLSGSEFVGSGLRKTELAMSHPGALAVEMEAAGIALVTKKANLPFCVVKTIADRLNPDHSVFQDFNLFVKSASGNAANVVRILWDHWTNEE